MGRPQKKRLVSHPPCCSSFKPTGVPRSGLKAITLSLDEYESLRLADYEQLDHAEAAEVMGVSRPTFTRLLDRARHQLGRFLVEGTELKINGGSVHFQGNLFRCDACNHLFRRAIGEKASSCPECGARTVTGLAASFGHGSCCEEHLEKRDAKGN